MLLNPALLITVYSTNEPSKPGNLYSYAECHSFPFKHQTMYIGPKSTNYRPSSLPQHMTEKLQVDLSGHNYRKPGIKLGPPSFRSVLTNPSGLHNLVNTTGI